MSLHTLSDIQWANEYDYPLRAYVYGADGYHSGCLWINDAQKLQAFLNGPARLAKDDGREVRITDAGDMMVFRLKPNGETEIAGKPED